ncbi:MAG: hypothetical protein CVV00_04035 [Firmicutes bacterium HGW-Firmicutes-5]|nr:MAG: hypothetical protein CVV00_04035 [Firmicutes bacterium HGW-Firmicutes-5]
MQYKAYYEYLKREATDIKLCDEDYDFYANHNLLLYAYWKEYMRGLGDATFFKRKLFMYKLDYSKILENLCEIGIALEEKGISYLVLKGVVIAETYPEPFTRNMGDYDILVHTKDFKLAKEILLEVGYVTDPKMNTYKDATFLRKGSLNIELHYAILNSEREPYVDDFTQRLWYNPIKHATAKGHIMIPQVEVHFTYIVLHMMKHLKGAGFGLRFLLDFMYFSEHHKIDHNEQLVFFEEIGYGEFYRSIASVCHYYLGMNIEYYSWLYDPKATVIQILAEYVAEGGSFGNGSERMRIANEYDKYKDVFNKKSKFFVFIELLFPPINRMSVDYSYINKYRFLLPIAWVQRLIEKSLSSEKGVKEKLFLFNQDKEFISKKEYMMRTLKLKNHDINE